MYEACALAELMRILGVCGVVHHTVLDACTYIPCMHRALTRMHLHACTYNSQFLPTGCVGAALQLQACGGQR